jgi:hypothetical protein
MVQAAELDIAHGDDSNAEAGLLPDPLAPFREDLRQTLSDIAEPDDRHSIFLHTDPSRAPQRFHFTLSAAMGRWSFRKKPCGRTMSSVEKIIKNLGFLFLRNDAGATGK